MPLTPESTPFRASATPSEFLRLLHSRTSQHTSFQEHEAGGTSGSKRPRADVDDSTEPACKSRRTTQKPGRKPSKAEQRSGECNDWISKTSQLCTADEDNMSVKELRNIVDVLGSQYLEPLDHGDLRMQGMQSKLYMYQILGVVWMRQKETGHNRLKGGIQGDDMGIGKTVMQLANIVHARLTFKGARESPTLVVVPSGLIDQCMSQNFAFRLLLTRCEGRREINKHCADGAVGKITEWHGAKAYGGNDTVQYLRKRGLMYAHILSTVRPDRG